MERNFYHNLTDQSLSEKTFSENLCTQILTAPEIELLPLLNAAYDVRKKFTGKEVTIHIINNSQNGHCPEDCHYCAQAKSSKADITEYPLKSDQEILAEAKQAYDKGAFRYCMVFAGRGPSDRRVEKLASLIKKIKAKYPLEICVSAGLMDQNKAKTLKEAGLDRLNHNLNTSEQFYPQICTSHTYKDRMETLNAAKNAGLELCSGVIVGMGESTGDVINVAKTLRTVGAKSIPVNFLVSIPGNKLTVKEKLTPEYCLRVLCLYRFLNPKAEIRIAAGREIHLGSMEVMSLYPANSLFLEGYLNARGNTNAKTLRMIKDAGFTVKSDCSLDQLIKDAENTPLPAERSCGSGQLKGLTELRPQLYP